MRLVEIVRGNATDPDVLASAMAIAKKLRKVGVVVGNCRGFRGQSHDLALYARGAVPGRRGRHTRQVDRALYDWGMAMGVFAVDDMAGIDVGWHVKQRIANLKIPARVSPLLLDKLYEMGRYGQKTGAGWFLYDANRKPSAIPK